MALSIETSKENRTLELIKSFESGGKRLNDNQLGLTKPSNKIEKNYEKGGSPPLS